MYERHIDQMPIRNSSEGGFSLLLAIVIVLLIAFIAAAAMGLMSVWWALLGFVIAVIVAVLIGTAPDIMRYIKISSM